MRTAKVTHTLAVFLFGANGLKVWKLQIGF